MKQLSLLVCILLLAGCRHSNLFTLNADVKGLASDSVLALFEFPEYHIDTIVAKQGKFTLRLPLDTLHLLTLWMDGVPVPVCAEKGSAVSIEGAKDSLAIIGDGDNALMNAIMCAERACPINFRVADSLVRTHPNSYTNLYVVRQFMAHADTIDYAAVNALLQQMGGNLKDMIQVMKMQDVMDKRVGSSAYHLANSLLMKGRDDLNVRHSDIKGCHVLLSFWATWDAASRAAQDSLAQVVKTLRKKPFVVISVSLDYDRDKWYEASDRDTTQWRQVFDGKGFDSELAKALDIRELPASVLLDERRMIVGRNLTGQEIIDILRDKSFSSNAKR